MSRFRPDGLSELLTKTFEIADFRAGVYVEIIAADLMPAGLVIAILLTLIQLARSRLQAAPPLTQINTPATNPRLIFSILLGWTVSWSSWLFISGNGRYILPILITTGPLLGILLLNILKRKDWYWLILILIIASQGFILHSASPSQGWSMLKNRWTTPHPFSNRSKLLESLGPDLIITPQSQTMTALIAGTDAAKNANILSLDFAQSMGNGSFEKNDAIKLISKAKRPVLFDAFSTDFTFNEKAIGDLRNIRHDKNLIQYGLSIEKESCRHELSSLKVMQIACALKRVDIQQETIIKPAPPAEEAMERIINLCGISLWPHGAKHVLPDGSLVQVFRESRYIILATKDGSLHVRWRQDLNFRIRWSGIAENRKWESIQCNDIIKSK